MKKALLLNAVDPAIGGVLIRGDRGTAKSSAVRALARLLPEYEAVEGCPYRCDPAIPARYCDDCRRRATAGPLPITRLPMRIVELPINASEDRLVGSIDIEAAVRAGTRRRRTWSYVASCKRRQRASTPYRLLMRSGR